MWQSCSELKIYVMNNIVKSIWILQIFCVISASSSCGTRCDSSSYCDNYENKCKSCAEICEGRSFNSMECSKECPQYIQNAFSVRKLETSQLHTLTIMVKTKFHCALSQENSSVSIWSFILLFVNITNTHTKRKL